MAATDLKRHHDAIADPHGAHAVTDRDDLGYSFMADRVPRSEWCAPLHREHVEIAAGHHQRSHQCLLRFGDLGFWDVPR